MNNSGRVGDVAASASVTSSNGRAGWINWTHGGQGGGGAHLGVSGGHGGGNSVGGNSGGGVVRVSQSIAVRGGTVAVVAKVVVTGIRWETVTIGGVEQGWVGLSLSLGIGLSLGNMDNSGRVGNIPASTSVTSSDSGDGSISETSGGQGG